MTISRSLVQSGLALTALTLGGLVYVLDRPAGSAQFIPQVIQFDSTAALQFGWIGANLPSFLHVYAFILLTMSVLRPTYRTLSVVCGGWLGIELLFEVGPQLAPSALLETLDPLTRFAPAGVFDPMDVTALILGTLAAYLTVISMTRRTKQ